MEVASLNERQRTLFRLNRLGYVFQDYALVPTDGRGEYLPPVQGAGHDRKGVHPGLPGHPWPCRPQGPGQLFTGGTVRGEQQRVAIARALINNPAILLADEPCANLNTRNSTIILELIRETQKELNQTVVMVSHEEWHRNISTG